MWQWQWQRSGGPLRAAFCCYPGAVEALQVALQAGRQAHPSIHSFAAQALCDSTIRFPLGYDLCALQCLVCRRRKT